MKMAFYYDKREPLCVVESNVVPREGESVGIASNKYVYDVRSVMWIVNKASRLECFIQLRNRRNS